MRIHPMLRAGGLLVTAGALAVAGSVGPAGAVDDTQPAPCQDLPFKDPAGDMANHLQDPTGAKTDSSDITAGFLQHTPSKGKDATTYNIVVKNLEKTVPDTFTTMSWTSYYTTGEGSIRFVKAWLDFAGGEAYEYGVFTPDPTGELPLTGVSQTQGQTTGKLFEGANGVIQVVVPEAHGKIGDTFQELYSASGIGKTLPASPSAPNRGLSAQLDLAPDEGAAAGKSWTVSTCPSGQAQTPVGGLPPAPVDTPPTTEPGTSAPAQSQPQPAQAAPGTRALPVTLVTKAVAAKKVKRSLALRLRSSEAVTNLGAQLRRGNAVVGRGKLAKLSGTGTLKLAVKKLKKGTYTLDLAGDTASGRAIGSIALKVR